jgi:hypothetical protein
MYMDGGELSAKMGGSPHFPTIFLLSIPDGICSKDLPTETSLLAVLFSGESL